MLRFPKLCTLGLCLTGSLAAASPNDFQVYRLGDPATSGVANGNFRAFTREMGAAITSVSLEPPTTLGSDGFSVNGELSIVNLSTGAGGFSLPTAGNFSGPWLMPSLHVRKGLPFSLEVGTRVAYLDQSSMGAATFEAKWAFTEGYPYMPAVAVRGYVTRLFNTQDFGLTSAGVDASVGKRFAIGGMITLTPYGGLAVGFTGATSDHVDFARNRDPATTQSTPSGAFDNTSVYAPVIAIGNVNNRIYGGVRFIGGVIQLGAELGYTTVGSFSESVNGTSRIRSLPGVLAFNSTIGLDF